MRFKILLLPPDVDPASPERNPGVVAVEGAFPMIHNRLPALKRERRSGLGGAMKALVR